MSQANPKPKPTETEAKETEHKSVYVVTVASVLCAVMIGILYYDSVAAHREWREYNTIRDEKIERIETKLDLILQEVTDEGTG